MFNSFSWLLDHRNVEFSFVNSLSGGAVSDKLWQNLGTGTCQESAALLPCQWALASL